MWSERNFGQTVVYKCYQPQAICGFTDDMGRVPGKSPQPADVAHSSGLMTDLGPTGFHCPSKLRKCGTPSFQGQAAACSCGSLTP